MKKGAGKEDRAVHLCVDWTKELSGKQTANRRLCFTAVLVLGIPEKTRRQHAV